MKRRAFTLIELLVVIAITSLLIAILLPALSAARQSGQSAKCLATLKNVGVGLAAYFNTNEDRFPLSKVHGGYQAGTAWLDTLEPYAQTTLQYRCPADHAKNFDAANPGLRRVTSYGINIFMSPNPLDWTASNPTGIPSWGYIKQTRLKDSSRWVYAAELAEVDRTGAPLSADEFHADHWGTNPFTGYGGYDPQYDLSLRRHLRKENYLFADSHAEHVAFDQLFHVSADGQTLEIDRFDPGFPHSPQGWFQPTGE